MFDTSVLVVGFNRPERLAEVLEQVAAAQPAELFVAIDGPRSQTDIGQVEQCRRVVTDQTWAQITHTRFRDRNLGCRRGMIDAVSWVMSEQEAAIIIEDDAVPDPTWFRFSTELLETYRHHSGVLAIAGESKVPVEFFDDESSYRFSRMGPAGAWATWRDRWTAFATALRSPLVTTLWRISKCPNLSAAEKMYWSALLSANATRAMDSWAYPFMLHGVLSDQLTVTPNGNLVTDTGIGPGARHMRSEDTLAQSVNEMKFPLRHPPVVSIDRRAEQWSEEHEFNTTPLSLLRSSTRFAQRLF